MFFLFFYFFSRVPQVAQEIRDQNVHGLSWVLISLCHIRLNYEFLFLFFWPNSMWWVLCIVLHSENACQEDADLVHYVYRCSGT